MICLTNVSCINRETDLIPVRSRRREVEQIQNELSNYEEAKYFHRLDLVLLAVSEILVKQITSLYNESPTTISYWTKKVVKEGIKSLKEGDHTGRKPRLNKTQLKQIAKFKNLCS